MILTTCAACAAPLAHTAPRCVRCKLRYCDSTCQHDHWRRGHNAASTTTLGDLVQAEALLKDTYARFRRVMGDGHPDAPGIRENLLAIREELARARASSHA